MECSVRGPGAQISHIGDSEARIFISICELPGIVSTFRARIHVGLIASRTLSSSAHLRLSTTRHFTSLSLLLVYYSHGFDLSRTEKLPQLVVSLHTVRL